MSGEFRATAKIVKDLDNKKFLELRRRVNLNGRVVRVGIPTNKVYREKDEKTGKWKRAKKGAKRVMLWIIGLTHEFGAPDKGIPARPWLRPGIRSGTPDYVRLNRRNLLAIVRGTMTQDTALKQLGAMATGKVQTFLRNSANFKPLKEATIKAKGSDKPLIDTGQLMQSVTFEVVDKKP